MSHIPPLSYHRSLVCFVRNHVHLCIRSFWFDEDDFGFKVDRFGFLGKNSHLCVRRFGFDEEELGFRRQVRWLD
ncbi:hypothetical protein ACOSP7_024121 [Xanthoceras sorbifolium]